MLPRLRLAPSVRYTLVASAGRGAAAAASRRHREALLRHVHKRVARRMYARAWSALAAAFSRRAHVARVAVSRWRRRVLSRAWQRLRARGARIAAADALERRRAEALARVARRFLCDRPKWTSFDHWRPGSPVRSVPPVTTPVPCRG